MNQVLTYKISVHLQFLCLQFTEYGELSIIGDVYSTITITDKILIVFDEYTFSSKTWKSVLWINGHFNKISIFQRLVCGKTYNVIQRSRIRSKILSINFRGHKESDKNEEPNTLSLSTNKIKTPPDSRSRIFTSSENDSSKPSLLSCIIISDVPHHLVSNHTPRHKTKMKTRHQGWW